MVFGRRAWRARKKPRMRCSHTGPECVLFFVVRAAEQIIQRYAEYFREREQVIKGGDIAVLFPGRRVARSDVEHFCDGILRHALGGAQLIVPFAKGVLLGRAFEVRVVRAPEQILHGYVEVE